VSQVLEKEEIYPDDMAGWDSFLPFYAKFTGEQCKFILECLSADGYKEMVK
jgi:hypothetical protein